MNRRYVVGALVVVALVGSVGVGSAVAGVGPAAKLLDGTHHELTDFDASEPRCTDTVTANISTEIERSGGATTITHAQNIGLADRGSTIGEPTLERVNDTAYVLSVPTEEGEGMAAQCLATARYEADMRIPVEEGPWTVTIEHDGEPATTLSGDSNGTSASASASTGVDASG